MGQTTMTGGRLEKYVNEGDNGDKILRAFITCFNCDEKCNQGNITAIIPPHDVSEEGELSEVDAAQLVEEISKQPNLGPVFYLIIHLRQD